MTAHPNRGARSAASTPSPEEIRAWRRERDLSAREAGALVHTTGRVWQQWESGERRMHPAFWELARAKGRQAAQIDASAALLAVEPPT